MRTMTSATTTRIPHIMPVLLAWGRLPDAAATPRFRVAVRRLLYARRGGAIPRCYDPALHAPPGRRPRLRLRGPARRLSQAARARALERGGRDGRHAARRPP